MPNNDNIDLDLVSFEDPPEGFDLSVEQTQQPRDGEPAAGGIYAREQDSVDLDGLVSGFSGDAGDDNEIDDEVGDHEIETV